MANKNSKVTRDVYNVVKAQLANEVEYQQISKDTKRVFGYTIGHSTIGLIKRSSSFLAYCKTPKWNNRKAVVEVAPANQSQDIPMSLFW